MFIILLFCSPINPAYDSGGTELDIFDTQILNIIIIILLNIIIKYWIFIKS